MANPSVIDRDQDSDMLALELARNEVGMKLPVRELLQDLHVAEEFFIKCARDALFRKKIKEYKRDLEEKGVDFQLKNRIQTDDAIKMNYRMIHDPETPHAVKVKCIENTVRWAGLEPKVNAPALAGPQSGFNIVFNWPTGPVPLNSAQQAQQAIDVTPTHLPDNG